MSLYVWICECACVTVSGCMCELFVIVSMSEYVCVSTVCLCVHI